MLVDFGSSGESDLFAVVRNNWRKITKLTRRELNLLVIWNVVTEDVAFSFAYHVKDQEIPSVHIFWSAFGGRATSVVIPAALISRRRAAAREHYEQQPVFKTPTHISK